MTNAEQTNQTPCSCGGSNENCAHCYGRGFVEAGRSKAGATKRGKGRPQTPSLSFDALALSNVLSSGASTVKCPVCQFRATTDGFTRHFALVHGTKGKQKAVDSMPRCPLCQVQVRKDRLQSHINVKCPSRASSNRHAPWRSKLNSLRSPSRRKSTVSLKDIQLFVTCPTCGIKVASDQFAKHRSVAHGGIRQLHRGAQAPVVGNQKGPKTGAGQRKKSEAIRNRDRSTESAPPESAREKGEIEVERPPWWDNLDATKDRGYPAREEGRYGSYPSHDGFDDESKP